LVVEKRNTAFKPQPRERLIRRGLTTMAESSSHSLVQKILETINVITTIGDFKTHKKECNTLTRRVNLLVPLFEEIRDDQNLRLFMSKEGLRCINSLESALHTAKVLLLFCNKGSKLYLVSFTFSIPCRSF
jgi:uncharacterized membrane-anchored protein YjiN (DUF445 family)